MGKQKLVSRSLVRYTVECTGLLPRTETWEIRETASRRFYVYIDGDCVDWSHMFDRAEKKLRDWLRIYSGRVVETENNSEMSHAGIVVSTFVSTTSNG